MRFHDFHEKFGRFSALKSCKNNTLEPLSQRA